MNDVEWMFFVGLIVSFGCIGWLWGKTEFFAGLGRHGRALQVLTILAVVGGTASWVLMVLRI